MDSATVEALKEALDNFLDNPKDKELEREYVEMLKQRSVYSFLSILYRINYPRLPMLLNVTNDIVRVYSNNKPIELESSSEYESSSQSTSSESQASSESSSEEIESSSEDEKSKYRTGTAFDLLMDEEC